MENKEKMVRKSLKYRLHSSAKSARHMARLIVDCSCFQVRFAFPTNFKMSLLHLQIKIKNDLKRHRSHYITLLVKEHLHLRNCPKQHPGTSSLVEETRRKKAQQEEERRL